MIVVMGSKGGAGATTVAAGLIGAANTRVIPVDLGLTNDLVGLGDRNWSTQSLDMLARLPDSRLDKAIAAMFSGRRPAAFALSGQGRVLHVKEAAGVLDLIESHGVLVADMGIQPLPFMLDLATHVALVLTPDPRSLRRAEQFTRQNSRLSIVPVLNMARPGECGVAYDEMIILPDAGRTDPLHDEAWIRAVEPLAEQLGLVGLQSREHSAPARMRSQRLFDWRGLIPRVRVVE